MSDTSLRELQIHAFRTLQKYLPKEHSDVIHNEIAVLLFHVFGFSKKDLILKKDEQLLGDRLASFNALLDRRIKHEPLAYLVGSQEFFSLDFLVTPDVLIPRRETELIVERVVAWFEDNTFDSLNIVDIGCGSGAIILGIAHELKNKISKEVFSKISFFGFDISTSACDVAKKNAVRFSLEKDVAIVHSDLLSNFEASGDIIFVSNPPYICEDEKLPRSVEEYEPRLALRAGVDGLDVYQRIFSEITPYLKEKSCRLALFEIGASQAAALECMANEFDFHRAYEVTFIKDMQNIQRILALQA